MKKKLFLLPLLSLSFLISGSTILKNDKEILARDGDYIVLLNKNHSFEDFKQEFNTKLGLNYRIKDKYEGIVHGLHISTSKEYFNTIKNFNSVQTLSINQVYKVLDTTTKHYDNQKVYSSNEIENDSLDEMNVPDDTKNGEGTFIAVIDSSFSLKHEAFKDLSTSLKKRVDEEKISTLINQDGFHANVSLKDCYYNDKIPFYHDYGGDGKLVNNDYEHNEDNDVFSPFSTHGMHTSSIATANGEFKGIAPNAQLAFLKVGTDLKDQKANVMLTDSILTALNDAYYLNVDAINMSLGSALYEEDDEATLEILSRLENKGISVNVSAGNDGKGNWKDSGIYKYFTTDQVETSILGSFATTSQSTVIAAGVLSDDDSLSSQLSVDGQIFDGHDQIINRLSADGTGTTYQKEMPFWSILDDDQKEGAFPYVIVPGIGSLNNVSDTGENLGNDFEGLDLKNKIAVIKRGNISFTEKIKNAQSLGAIAVIIANDAGLGTLSYFDLADLPASQTIPAYSVSKETFDLLNNANNKVLAVSKNYFTDFSSEGVLGNLTIKPDITTPGKNIIGAINTDETNSTEILDKYMYMDGTSMAAPNYTGAYALALSNKTFNNEEERLAYAKTLKNRFMSTSDPIMQGDETPVSVRKQGAGMIDVEGALETSIYLKGSEGETKVNLGNSEDIKNGNIKFDVEFINESKKAAKFKPTLYVTVPQTVLCDSENYPEFKDTKFQTTDQRLLKKVELSEVSLTGKESEKYTVSYQLDKKTIDEVLSTFEDGVTIEGFVTFDAVSSNTEDLSIPYLGFLGDYSKGEAVEPFDFEKEENKVYGSDLLNNLLEVTGAQKPEANFSSLIGLSSGGLEGIDMEKYLLHEVDPKKDLIEISYNIDENGKYHLFAGTEGVADTLYIQQFVNRSVKDNKVTLTNEKGNVVLVDHMFDALYSTGEETTHSLGKTFATTDLFINNFISASRAYTIIPLKDKENNSYYDDGIYTLKFEYELMDGTIQEKEYYLEISSETIGNNVLAFDLDQDGFSIMFKEDTLKCSVNSIEGLKEASNKYSFKFKDLKVDGFEDNLYIEVLSKDYSVQKGVFSDDGSAILFAPFITKGYSFSLSTSANNITLKIYDFNDKVVSINEEASLVILDGTKFSNNSFFSDKNEELEHTLNENNVLEIKINTKNIVLGEGNNPSSSNLLWLYITIGAIVLIGAGVLTFILVKKKSKNKE